MRDCQKRLSTAFFDNKVPRRRRKLHILCSRLKPRAQSFRCSSSPTKCILRFVGSRRSMGTGAALRASVVRQRRTIRHCASSSQAAYPSLPAKAESSVIPLLLLSHEVHSALRGFHRRTMEVGLNYPPLAANSTLASSLKAAYPSLPAKAESSVIPLLLLSHEVQYALRGFHKRPMEIGAALCAASCISFAPG